MGKYNGAGKFSSASTSVWQMIILSFLLILMYLPATFAIDFCNLPTFFNNHISYLKITMLFGFLDPLMSALGAFFIGIGRNMILTNCRGFSR